MPSRLREAVAGSGTVSPLKIQLGKPQEGSSGVGSLGIHGEGKGFPRTNCDRGIEAGFLDIGRRRAVFISLDSLKAQVSRWRRNLRQSA